MIRPACLIATSRTSSRPNEELTAEAIASSSAARSRAPLSSSSASCSRRVMPRILMSAIFIQGGINKALAPAATIGSFGKLGLPMPGAAYALTLVVEIGVGTPF